MSSLALILALAASASFGGEGEPRLIAGTGESASPEAPYRAGEPAGRATEIPLGNPYGVEARGDTLWITTIDDHSVWAMDLRSGEIQRVAGCGVEGYAGDGGPATEARLNRPHEVRVDEAGNLYIADTFNHAVRRVDARTGVISTLAGDGRAGDGERLRQPHSIALEDNGALLVADTGNHRVLRVALRDGRQSVVSGNGEPKMPSEGAAAADAPLHGPRSLAVAGEGVWIVLREGNSLWRLAADAGTLHRVAGTGRNGYGGDRGDPRAATFRGPKGVAVDAAGRVYVVDTENHAIRLVDPDGSTIATVLDAGPDGKRLARPHGVCVTADGAVIVSDSENHRVLRIAAP